MVDGGIHVQPLLRGLFTGDDDIYQISAAQASVGDAEQRIGIRWQIYANDIGLLVHYMVDKAGVLMRKAVVILLPNVRGEQDI